jgi:putative FmdB family regulatory protein
MPIYEYYCPKCGVKFEVLRPMSKASEGAACPICKSEAKRAMSTFAAFDFDSVGYRNFVPGAGGVRSSCSSAGCDTCHQGLDCSSC